MTKTFFAAVAIAALGVVALPSAGEAKPQARFHVVDGDTGRVVYDDGRNDGGCVFRRRFVGYDYWGNPRFRKVYHCY
jgi:hypothetical protein